MKIILNNKLFITYFVFLLIPFFFLLNGTIYFESTVKLNSQNNLYNVPIPISCFFSVLLIAYIFYKKKIEIFNNKILKVLIYSFASLILCLAVSKNLNYERILELIQFLLPWMGLIIALNLKRNNNIYIIIYYFLFIFLSLQLLITIFLDKRIIISDIFFFTVYQNIQYVGTIFTLLTILVSINLYRERKFSIIFLIIISITYSTLTYSFSSVAVFTIFILGYFINLIFQNYKNKKTIFKIFSFLLLFFIIFFYLFKHNSINIDKDKFITKENNGKNYYENILKFKDLLNFKTPQNISLRFEIWENYYSKIINNKKILLIGDKNRKLDKKYRSSHNLLIDIVYKFGLILIIPYLFLFFLVLFKLYNLKNDKKDFLSLLFVCIVVFIENIFKVSLKQPYPGMISFYLIGFYLNKYR